MMNFKNYKSETDGNVAMMFAVSTLMIVTGIGAAIDFSNISRAKNILQSQVDAGVLAAATVEVERRNQANGHAFGLSAQEKEIREGAAKKVLSANGYDLTGITPVLTLNERSVELKAELDYKPSFGRILGFEKVRLVATAESGLPGADGVDIALVLDNTRSMEVNGKMQALEDGAVKLVEAIEDSSSESKIAVVPFARYVRVDDSARTASWFQMPTEFDTPRTWQQATHTGGSCVPVTGSHRVDGVEIEYATEDCTGQTTTYEERNTTVESRWDGCVGTRLPPYSERDDAYSHKIPGLLNKVPKEHTGLTYDVNTWCPHKITPLTDDYDTLETKIRGMWTTDNTYLPTGLIWGQRVLSPGEPYDNAPVAGEAEKRKVMVLMTDGNNTTEIMQDSASETYYKAPPYIGNVAEDTVATDANAATARLCESVKASGIEIYTIAFQVTDAATVSLLRNCASDVGKALTANSNAELVAEFENVAKSLKADIRLMR